MTGMTVKTVLAVVLGVLQLIQPQLAGGTTAAKAVAMALELIQMFVMSPPQMFMARSPTWHGATLEHPKVAELTAGLPEPKDGRFTAQQIEEWVASRS
jgi:hypothetical protein